MIFRNSCFPYKSVVGHSIYKYWKVDWEIVYSCTMENIWYNFSVVICYMKMLLSDSHSKMLHDRVETTVNFIPPKSWAMK